jgi:surfeit locus 1 family protein
MLLKEMFSWRNLLATLIAIVAIGLMLRLGIWQLDRREQRRQFNARVASQISAQELILAGDNLLLDLFNMEYRSVVVDGVYDHEHEFVLRNQVWVNPENVSYNGVHLLTPLLIKDSDKVVLVDRGWIPAQYASQTERKQFSETGEVVIHGIIRRSQSKGQIGFVVDPTLAPGENRLDVWNNVNVERIQEQLPYEMLDIYVLQLPEAAHSDLPYRHTVHIELTEGSHLGFAMQWFIFAVIVLVGYPLFIRNQMHDDQDEPRQ